MHGSGPLNACMHACMHACVGASALSRLAAYAFDHTQCCIGSPLLPCPALPCPRSHLPQPAPTCPNPRRTDKEHASERSIPGLMNTLERGEMPAAVQPPGLTVTMRPYQLQSLQFMLDCEGGSGGFRRLLWQRLATPHGKRYWWSPLLGRAALDVPEQPWGGWCAEEMGLGKVRMAVGWIWVRGDGRVGWVGGGCC